MSATLDQQKEAALALLSDRLSAQPASLLDALLAQPMAPITTTARVTKPEIFRLGDRTFDLGPEHESELSSDDDDAPIRNPRQLKTEMRSMNAVLRRANRRVARHTKRISAHLSKNETIPTLEVVKKVKEPLGQEHNPIILDEDVMEVTPRLKATKTAEEDKVKSPNRQEDYNSPAPSSPLSSAPSSFHKASLSPPSSSPIQDVAEYKRVDSLISNSEQAPGQTPSYTCTVCNYKTQYFHNWTRHCRGQTHLNKVSGSLPRKGPNIKYVKPAPGKTQPEDRYCDACDHLYLQRYWHRHVTSGKHAANVEKKIALAKKKQGDKKTRQDVCGGPKRVPEHYCEACDRHFLSNHWSSHLKGQLHLDVVAMKKGIKEKEEVRLHAPTPEPVEPEAGIEEDGFADEEYGHYCDDCEVTFAGKKWAQHLASAGHVFNSIRFSQGNDDDESIDSGDEDESMADYEIASEDERTVYDDATDDESMLSTASTASSPSAASGSATSFSGTPVDELICPSSPSSASSPSPSLSFSTTPPSTRSSPALPRPSKTDFYCQTCDATLVFARPWDIGVHVAGHQYEMRKRVEVATEVTTTGEDWLCQLEEAAAAAGVVEREMEIEG